MRDCRCNSQTALTTQAPNANYHQAQNTFRPTIGSELEHDGSHSLWQSTSQIITPGGDR